MGSHQDGGHILGSFVTMWTALQIQPASSTIFFFSQPLKEILIDGFDGIDAGDTPQEAIHVPEVEPGDVFLFDRFCLHGTFIDEHKHGARTSMDVRLYGA
jgi:hypothetical protein